MQVEVSDSVRKELVALFESHGALAEPALLAELASSPDGAVRAQAVLAGLREVPFHFDAELWAALEAKSRDVVVAALPVPAGDQGRGRKEALKRAAALVYDGHATAEEEGEAAESEEADDGGGGEEAPRSGAQEDAKGFRIEARGDWRPAAADHASRFEPVADITGNSTCEGTTEDFVTYFQDRYRQIAKMLRGRRELRNAVAVERVKAGAQEVQLIGMVVSIHTTKNGHRRIEVEDETGAIACMVKGDDRPLVAMADSLVEDEVVGVVGKVGGKGEIVFVESIPRPDIPLPDQDRKKGADAPVMAAFLSDVHV
ncbi:MAG: hypothetical protein LC620_06885, partial [Halobacteriales archaeon]|nr:hypothetical protein [Halobacteriales archaeon]